MKIRIGKSAQEFSDRYRRAINYRVGKRGKATYDETVKYITMLLDADAETICSEMDDDPETCPMCMERIASDEADAIMCDACDDTLAADDEDADREEAEEDNAS